MTTTNNNNLEFLVWIGNLHAYNCGELRGEWLDFLELDIDEITEKIAEICDGGKYEHFIADYSCSFSHSFGEWEDIEELKDLADVLSDLSDEFGDHLNDVLDAADYFGIKPQDIDSRDIIIHYGCEDMTDIAYEYIEECGLLDSMPENLRNYFDYAAFGRDMSYEGSFYEGGKCIIEYIR